MCLGFNACFLREGSSSGTPSTLMSTKRMCLHGVARSGHVHVGVVDMLTMYTFPVDPKTYKCGSDLYKRRRLWSNACVVRSAKASLVGLVDRMLFGCLSWWWCWWLVESKTLDVFVSMKRISTMGEFRLGERK